MRFLNIFLVFAAIFAVVYAAPQAVEDEIEPRITCDIIGGEWGDRACAAHCIGLKHSGGYCNEQKVCVCRD